MKGPYARRTETTRDETRQSIRESRTDAHEVQACEETIKACDAYWERLTGKKPLTMKDMVGSNSRLGKKKPKKKNK